MHDRLYPNLSRSGNAALKLIPERKILLYNIQFQLGPSGGNKKIFLTILRLCATRWVMADLKLVYNYMIWSGFMPLLSSILLYLADMKSATFGLGLPEFIQVGFHLLGRFFASILAPFAPSPLLFLYFLLFSKNLAMAPPLLYLLAGSSLNVELPFNTFSF